MGRPEGGHGSRSAGWYAEHEAHRTRAVDRPGTSSPAGPHHTGGPTSAEVPLSERKRVIDDLPPGVRLELDHQQHSAERDLAAALERGDESLAVVARDRLADLADLLVHMSEQPHLALP